MKLFYGSYQFAEHGVNIATSAVVERSPTGLPISVTYTYSLRGTIKGSTSADVKAKVIALEAACSGPSQDLILYLEDDVTRSTTLLTNQGSLYGVVCTQPPSYPSTFGPENLTVRRWQATFEAKYPLGDAGDEALSTISFQESLQFSGGEPRYVFHEDINGLDPILEITIPKTTYRAIQSGTAVGYFGYPPVPPPIFGGDGVAVVSEYSEQGPPDGVKDWTISWSYAFESAQPLRGLHPHYWISGGFQ